MGPETGSKFDEGQHSREVEEVPPMTHLEVVEVVVGEHSSHGLVEHLQEWIIIIH